MSEPAKCASCGSPLAPGDGEPRITCDYCHTEQPHPRPLAFGSEVIYLAGGAGRLGVVTDADGPDAITVEPPPGEKGKGGIWRLSDLTPVGGADAVATGDRVFARGHAQWERRWVSDVDGAEVTLKHAHPRFQSNFFDKKFPRSAIRIPLREADRDSRTHSEAIVARLKNDPTGTIFRAMHTGIFVLVGLGFLSFFVKAAWGFIQAAF